MLCMNVCVAQLLTCCCFFSLPFKVELLIRGAGYNTCILVLWFGML